MELFFEVYNAHPAELGGVREKRFVQFSCFDSFNVFDGIFCTLSSSNHPASSTTYIVIKPKELVIDGL